MRTTIITLGAAALGLALATPAFAQEARPCIHFESTCSDAPYPVTASAPSRAVRHTYARRAERHLYNSRAQAPQPADPPACIHFEASCSDAPYPVTHS